MSFLQIRLSVIVLFLLFNKSVYTDENSVPITKDTSQNSSESMDVRQLIELIFNVTISQPDQHEHTKNHSSLLRAKREQQGESKYTTASKMPETKMIRLIAQMLANPFSTAYIGGGHPFHPEVPKSIVILFKQKIMDFLFPRIGDRF